MNSDRTSTSSSGRGLGAHRRQEDPDDLASRLRARARRERIFDIECVWERLPLPQVRAAKMLARERSDLVVDELLVVPTGSSWADFKYYNSKIDPPYVDLKSTFGNIVVCDDVAAELTRMSEHLALALDAIGLPEPTQYKLTVTPFSWR
jgi:hypothetical protein